MSEADSQSMLMPGLRGRNLRSILLLGAHADDIEIGCGGTVFRLLILGLKSRSIGTSSAPPDRGSVKRAAVPRRGSAPPAGRTWESLTSARAISQVSGPTSRSAWSRIRTSCEPDLIFTHRRDDLHQDHRVVSDLTWNAFRSHTILEYEIPKYDGDIGNPNLYVALGRRACRRKVAALMKFFTTQTTKPWFTEDTFFSLLRLRGIESGGRTQFAEAFYARKLVV